jgi:hypothetical protein
MSDILFPVARMIGGNMYKPQRKLDNFGKPKLDKEGKPATAFNFGIAIAKGAEQHWSQTPWGAEILKVGQAAYPKEYSAPAFAWKLTDGDSNVPNKKGNLPCNQEGYPGHWIIWFNQAWCPKLVNADGKIQLTEPDSIVPGYFIQVFGSVKSNAPSPSPGVFLNPIAVALAGYGERIESSGVDTAAVGFGGGALPPGASAVPAGALVAATLNAASPFANVAGVSATPALPNPAFLTIPGGVPALPPALPPAHVMTANAAGASYEQMTGIGWTDDLLRAHGMMV